MYTHCVRRMDTLHYFSNFGKLFSIAVIFYLVKFQLIFHDEQMSRQYVFVYIAAAVNTYLTPNVSKLALIGFLLHGTCLLHVVFFRSLITTNNDV